MSDRLYSEKRLAKLKINYQQFCKCLENIKAFYQLSPKNLSTVSTNDVRLEKDPVAQQQKMVFDRMHPEKDVLHVSGVMRGRTK